MEWNGDDKGIMRRGKGIRRGRKKRAREKGACVMRYD